MNFKIICQANPVLYCLELPLTYCTSPTFHTSLLKTAHPLLEIDGGQAYLVHTILDPRRGGEHHQYPVDWAQFYTWQFQTKALWRAKQGFKGFVCIVDGGGGVCWPMFPVA